MMGPKYDYPAVDANTLLANRQRPIDYTLLDKSNPGWFHLDAYYEVHLPFGAEAKWLGGISLLKYERR